MTKKFMVLVLCAMLVFLMTACFAVDPEMVYVGDHPDLDATAIHSIPGIDSSRDDKFFILDEDQYGRVLFAAYLPDSLMFRNSFDDGILAVMIMQGRSDSSVQFYSEKNYLAKIVETSIDLNEELICQHFSEEAITALKEANDWNRPAVSGDCIHVPLSAEKKESLSSKMREQIEEKVGTNIRAFFFREGTDGTKIFFVMRISKASTKTAYTWYLVAFDDEDVLIEDSVTKISKDMEILPSEVAAFLNGNTKK